MAKISVCDICGGSVRSDSQPLDKDRSKLVSSALGKNVEDVCFNCKRYVDSFASAFKYLKSGGKDTPAKKEAGKKTETARTVTTTTTTAAPVPVLNTSKPELKVVTNSQPGVKGADAAGVPNARA